MHRYLTFVLLSGLCGVSGADTADRERDDAASAAAAADLLSNVQADEEIVVRGRMTRGALRLQIELAEDAFYGRFNEVNSHDEFDIVCKRVAETGSRMHRRRCEPNFLRDANAHVGRETARALQGSAYALNPQQFTNEVHYKRRLLETEMKELAETDRELREALAKLVTLQQVYSNYED